MATQPDTSILLKALPGSIGAALSEGECRLRAGGALRPRRHAELLLEAALNYDRTQLYLNARRMLGARERKVYEAFLQRREAGEPVQHIVGWAPFFGFRFIVGKGVFIPRFDSELLVERLLERWKMDQPDESPVEVLDLCCGCGAIGITVAAELPGARVTLSDNSDPALEYSMRNIKELQLGDRVGVYNWDATSQPPIAWVGKFRYILANPPYIPPGDLHTLHRDVLDGEPRASLTDGIDGFSFYRRWADTLPRIMRAGGRLFTECADRGAAKTHNILSVVFKDLVITKDINGVGRVVEGKLGGDIK